MISFEMFCFCIHLTYSVCLLKTLAFSLSGPLISIYAYVDVQFWLLPLKISSSLSTSHCQLINIAYLVLKFTHGRYEYSWVEMIWQVTTTRETQHIKKMHQSPFLSSKSSYNEILKPKDMVLSMFHYSEIWLAFWHDCRRGPCRISEYSITRLRVFIKYGGKTSYR